MKSTDYTKIVAIGVGPDGQKQPEIRVAWKNPVRQRELSAYLHLLAASAELETPPRECWIVHEQLDLGVRDPVARVYIELAGDTAQELTAARATLRRVWAKS